MQKEAEANNDLVDNPSIDALRAWRWMQKEAEAGRVFAPLGSESDARNHLADSCRKAK